MFRKNNGISFLYLMATITLAIVTVPAMAMTAYSITYKEHIEEAGKQFWQIRVTCTDLNTRRFIVRSRDKDPWCAKDMPSFCANDKVQAALNICSYEYKIALQSIEGNQENPEQNIEAQVDQEDDNKSVLLEQQALIQDQRIQLAQRKLDLRRRGIDLQKREIELRDRIANLP
ncbi:MAG: hypothetical protein ACI9WC_001694 [Arenicella sp.]|jgi:hypothetical protein